MTIRSRYPPPVTAYRTWQDWADALGRFLTSPVPIGEPTLPQVVQLAHQVGTGNIGSERPGTPGLLMYDPVQKAIVYSDENNQWRVFAPTDWVAENFQYAAYGAIQLDRTGPPPAGNDITATPARFLQCDDLVVPPRGLGITLPDIVTFEAAGVYSLTLSLSFSCTKVANTARLAGIRTYNLTTATPSPNPFGSILVPENTEYGAASMSFLFPVDASIVGDQLTFEVSMFDGPNITGIQWRLQRLNIQNTGGRPEFADAPL